MSVACSDLPQAGGRFGSRGKSATLPVDGGSGFCEIVISFCMGNVSQSSLRFQNKLISDILLGLPWFEFLINLWKIGKRIYRRLTNQGMYEVLEYVSTLELLDDKGKKAKFFKRQRVRYLQDSIIAFQDQAWGDGEILLNYRCSPGVAVDRYRPGNKTYILISLREVKRRGEEDEFHIEWGIRNGFLRDIELWETEINHPTRHLKVKVIFPKTRVPKRFWVHEGYRLKPRSFDAGTKRRLPDGRWQIDWEMNKPNLNEHYILKWEW